ncbi:MAG: Cof-type HAD-IIB family hydrolase [Firmicutes bacterium]|jgi:Cof subfamily protein (haloacid dehalogenase superfamily)|nr:Cof-type HAD-IIB family hydrolase [Bacillota bacterium]
MVKLVAIDLDGTLLRTDRTISEKSRRVIRAALREGVLVVIATGRMFRSAQQLVQEIADDLPIAAYNGALIKMSGSGKSLLHIPIPAEVGSSVVRFLWDFDIPFQAYYDDQLWVRKHSESSAMYSSHYGVEVHTCPDIQWFLERDSTKYLITEDPGRIPAIRSALEPVVGPDLRMMRSLPHMLEIVHRRASKAHAVEFLAGFHGIDMQETMAVGDAENDLEMFESAGISVAVGNAQDQAKERASFVVSSNDEDGVVEAFERFIFWREEGS